MNILVFAYNFPHVKSCDMILHLFVAGHTPTVVAADAVPLSQPDRIKELAAPRMALLHPATLCKRLGLVYHVLPHNSSFLLEFLDKQPFDLGVIGGARIIDRRVIERFDFGILNLHPGLIPEARGLDALLWSVYNDVPLGVTAHLIDERVDAGRIACKRTMPVYRGDNFYTLRQRLHDLSLEMLPDAVTRAAAEYIDEVDVGRHSLPPPNRAMIPVQQREAMNRLPAYIERYAE